MAAWYPAMLVGWSLTQFAWQGALVLAAFLVVRRSLAGARAHARYRVALASLATLGALPLVTLVAADRALWSGPPAPDVAPAAPLYDAPAALAGALALVWAAGVLVGAVRLAGGWLRIRRLLRRRPSGGPLAALVRELARACGLAGAPRVVETSGAGAPFVAGVLRPVLVLPRGIAGALGAPELRALLLHELAHVRRHDVALNACQRALEVLLWFHPAVWVVSRAIATEREHCCDDDVVRASTCPLDLARALVTLEERRGLLPGLTLGGSGSGSSLGARIRRLLAPDAAGARVRPAAGAGFLVLASGILALSALASGHAAGASGTLRDLVPVVSIAAHDPAGRFTLDMVGGRAREVRLEGRLVPAERVRQRGRTVHVLDHAGRTALAVHVAPDGRGIHWEPRR